MSEEQIDLFQVKMTINEPVVKPPKPLPDSTTSFVRDADDPRLKQTTEVNTPEDLLAMLIEIEGMIVLAQTNVRNLIKKDNKGTASVYESLPSNDGMAPHPF